MKYKNRQNRNIKSTSNECIFDQIPMDCLQHVMGFMDKEDIAIFKLSSRRIALQCIKHMRKCVIVTIDGKTLLNNRKTNQ